METIDVKEGMSIFIKRGPGIFDTDKAKAVLDRINADMDENPELEDDPLINSIANSIYQLSKGKGEVDYSGCDTFWTADETKSDGQGITLVEQDNTVQLKETFENYEELSKKFIDLREFLSEAKYVGRYFKRTVPIENDRSFLEEDKNTLVLFATESHMLIEYGYEYSDEKKYEMLSPRYFEDGKFEYYGEQNNEYNDKEAVFHTIEKQLIKGKRNIL